MPSSPIPAAHGYPESQPQTVHGVTQPRTVIVLLNWNGAQDSMDCIESLLRMSEQDFIIVLCDNDSKDGSFDRLLQWGKTAIPTLCATWKYGEQPPTGAKLVLIQTGANLGFAGGCNVGLRYALLHTGSEFVWLLNNDTIAEPRSLGLQVTAMRERPHIGILGSTLVYFNDRNQIQAAAGYDFNFWTGRVLPLAKGSTPSNLPNEAELERDLKYVSGASMFVRRSFVETVGLLNEQYFLYFEEVDWAWRGRDQFGLGYCADSIVWHKEGKAIGSSAKLNRRSAFSEGYLARNRVLFTRTYFPGRLVTCLFWIVFVGMIRALRGQWRPAWILWRGAMRGLAAPILPIPAVSEWPKSMRQTSA